MKSEEKSVFSVGTQRNELANETLPENWDGDLCTADIEGLVEMT